MTDTAKKKRWLTGFGLYFIVPVFSIGAGIITTVFVGQLLFSSLTLPWLITFLAIAFTAEAAVAFYFYKDSVPEALIQIFLGDLFKDLNSLQKIILVLGLLSILGGGFAFVALMYTSGMTAFTTVFSLMGVSVAPALITSIAIFFAVLGGFAFSSLLLKWVVVAIKDNVHQQIAKFFQEMFARDEKKLLAQQILEVSCKLLFLLLVISIAVVGTIALLATMQIKLCAFLLLLPNADPFACQIASSVIVFGLASISRLPWKLRALCTVFIKLGEWIGYGIFRLGLWIATTLKCYTLPEAQKIETPDPIVLTVREGASYTAKAIAAVVHGFNVGSLGESGGGALLADVITHADTSLPPETAEKIGQGIAMATSGLMATTIAICQFQFFTKTSVEEEEECASKTSMPVVPAKADM